MTLAEELFQVDSLFLDTAPVIYYIEAHPQFGSLAKQIVEAFQSGSCRAFSSVITLTEVLPKPVEAHEEELVRSFINFLTRGKNLTLMEISTHIAEAAGRLRGRYPALRALDALQIAVSIDVGATRFVTNDLRLKQVQEMKCIVLRDYL